MNPDSKNRTALENSMLDLLAQRESIRSEWHSVEQALADVRGALYRLDLDEKKDLDLQKKGDTEADTLINQATERSNEEKAAMAAHPAGKGLPIIHDLGGVRVFAGHGMTVADLIGALRENGPKTGGLR